MDAKYNVNLNIAQRVKLLKFGQIASLKNNTLHGSRYNEPAHEIMVLIT